MSMRRVGGACLACAVVLAALWGAIADDKTGAKGNAQPLSPEEAREASLAALKDLGGLIGEWRGVGRPRRNSNVDAWIETGEWIWELKKDGVGLRYGVKEGRQITTALLTFDPVKKEYVLDATLADKTKRRYAGALDANRLSLLSRSEADGRVHQIDIKLLNEKRTVLLYQTRLEAQQQFALVAEVGYTREGTHLAEEGAAGPECIVTGGRGTMSTVYKGKTYWFCCTGCRDAFKDDPDGIIAEATARAAKKKGASEKEAAKSKP
jgi:YHS domain-containing protein